MVPHRWSPVPVGHKAAALKQITTGSSDTLIHFKNFDSNSLVSDSKTVTIGQTSPEVQNKGTDGPTKRTNVLQIKKKLTQFSKVRLILASGFNVTTCEHVLGYLYKTN